jgi:hypothetical protein
LSVMVFVAATTFHAIHDRDVPKRLTPLSTHLILVAGDHRHYELFVGKPRDGEVGEGTLKRPEKVQIAADNVAEERAVYVSRFHAPTIKREWEAKKGILFKEQKSSLAEGKQVFVVRTYFLACMSCCDL